MNYKHFIGLILVLFSLSCKKENHLTKIEGHRLDINDSLPAVQSIEDFIEPYRNHVNKNLDSVISYSKNTYSKNDGELNTAVGNLMADIVYEQGNPIYKSRTGKKIDVVILNHGGIRSIISKGNITPRTAFKLMPFENNIVVIEMKGIYVKELVTYLKNAKRAHPISGLKLHLNTSYEVVQATINGEEIIDENLYSVATNDYLYSGGDNMEFLQKGDSLHTLDYKIRNAIIDYFNKYDTINPVIDDRFIITN
jgi:5'-nucleotidase